MVLSTSRSELEPCLCRGLGVGGVFEPVRATPTLALSLSHSLSVSHSLSFSLSLPLLLSLSLFALALALALALAPLRSRSRSCSCLRSHTLARSRSRSRVVFVGRCSRTSDRRRPRRVRAEVGLSSLSSSVSSVDGTHRRSTWEGRAGGWAGLGGVHFDRAPVKGALSNEMHSLPGCCCSGASEHPRG